MDATKSRLLALVRAALGGGRINEQDFAGLSSDAWNSLTRLAAVQGVMALTWDCLQQLPEACQPPREVRIRWAMSTEQIARHYARQRTVIAKLASFYTSIGIRMMLLKGYGLSLCYPTPEQRPCGDVDIWLFGEQTRADKAMRSAWQVAIDEDKHHHTVFHIDGVMVENHYDFLNVHAHASNRDIEAMLRREVTREGETIQLPLGESSDAQQVSVLLPTADFNALFLLRHAAGHFAAQEIVLRHVIDWMLFVKRYHTQIDWAGLETTMRTMNMHRFLYCMNVMAINLGLDEGIVPPFERDSALEKRVFEDVLEPEFDQTLPKGNLVKVVWYKTRRWWKNRWKHRIVYREGLLETFIRSSWSHLLKPKSIG